MTGAFAAALSRAATAAAPQVCGTVRRVVGLSIEVAGLRVAVGDLVRVLPDHAGSADPTPANPCPAVALSLTRPTRRSLR